jgi:cell shape-determining protein MreC
MLLRREGLYSWHLKYFRQWRDAMSPDPQKPSSQTDTLAQLRNELARLKRENERLKLKLRQKDTLLELQKKMAELFQNENTEPGESEP